MAEGPLLGTTFLEFRSNGPALTAALVAAERQSQVTGATIERNMGAAASGVGRVVEAHKNLGSAVDSYRIKSVLAYSVLETAFPGHSRILRILISQFMHLTRVMGEAASTAEKFTIPAIGVDGKAFSVEATAGAASRLVPALTAAAGAAAIAAAAVGGIYLNLKLNDTGELELIKDWFSRVGSSIWEAVKMGIGVGSKGEKAGIYDALAESLGLSENVQLPSDINLAGKRPVIQSVEERLAQLAQWKAQANLAVERAEIDGDTTSVLKLREGIADLDRQEAVLNKTTKENAETIRAMTVENLRAADATKKRTEAEKAANAAWEKRQTQFAELARRGGDGTWRNVPKDILKPGNYIDTEDMQFAQQLGGGVQKVLDVALLVPVQTTLERIALEYAKNAMTLNQVYSSAIGSVETLFVDVFDAAITGKLHSLDDAFKNFLRSVTAEIERMMAQRAVQALLRWAGTWGGGETLPTTSATFSNGSPITTLGGANGGIFPGGFRAFASGGVVSRPTLGLVGEGRYNEAVVPLPDGKSIPVQMAGRGRGGEQHEVTVRLDYGLVAAMSSQSVAAAHAAVLVNIREGGDIHREISKMIRSRS